MNCCGKRLGMSSAPAVAAGGTAATPSAALGREGRRPRRPHTARTRAARPRPLPAPHSPEQIAKLLEDGV